MEYYNYTEKTEINTTCTGEQRLCIEMIDQAIRDSDKHETISKDAIKWILSNSKDPFSFLWCLEHAFPQLYDTIDIKYIRQTCLKKSLKCKRSMSLLPTSRSSSLYIKQ